MTTDPSMTEPKRSGPSPVIGSSWNRKAAGAVYDSMVVWISEDTLRYLQVEYYDKGAPVKVMTLEDYRPVGDLFYPFKATMTSLTRKSVSVMETEFIEYDSPDVEERFFTTAYLDSIR